jgi:hypothetical protein
MKGTHVASGSGQVPAD